MPYQQGTMLQMLGQASENAGAPLPLDRIRARRMQREAAELEEFKADTQRINALSSASASSSAETLKSAIEEEMSRLPKLPDPSDPNYETMRMKRATMMMNSQYMPLVKEGNRMFGQIKQESERTKKINHLLSLNLSETEAIDVVDGRWDLSPRDEFGNMKLVNKRTGETKPVGGSQNMQPQGMPQGAPQQSPQVAQQPQVEPQGTPHGMPQTNSIMEDAREGTGLVSNTKQGISNLIGFMLDEPMWPENAEARQRLGYFNKYMTTALVESGRMPMGEQNFVKSLLVTPEQILKDPKEAVSNMVQLKNFLESSIQINEDAIKNSLITPQKRGELADRNEAMRKGLLLMGDTREKDTSLEDKVADGLATDAEIEQYLESIGQ